MGADVQKANDGTILYAILFVNSSLDSIKGVNVFVLSVMTSTCRNRVYLSFI